MALPNQNNGARLPVHCTHCEGLLNLARHRRWACVPYFRNWPITSASQFGPCPLLVEPDIAIGPQPLALYGLVTPA
jgi:hypothetical protein